MFLKFLCVSICLASVLKLYSLCLVVYLVCFGLVFYRTRIGNFRNSKIQLPKAIILAVGVSYVSEKFFWDFTLQQPKQLIF